MYHLQEWPIAAAVAVWVLVGAYTAARNRMRAAVGDDQSQAGEG